MKSLVSALALAVGLGLSVPAFAQSPVVILPFGL